MGTEGEHTHTWRYNNSRDVFICTSCYAQEDPDTGMGVTWPAVDLSADE